MTENYDTQNIQKKAEMLVEVYNEMCRIMEMIDGVEGLEDIYFENELLEVVPETLSKLRKDMEAWNAAATTAYTKQKRKSFLDVKKIRIIQYRKPFLYNAENLETYII